MAWTYNPTQLATSDLFQVRFLIGDTDSADQLLQDEEINFLLAQIGSVNGAAVACCDNLSAKFTRSVDHTLGPYSVKASQRATHFAQLAKQIGNRVSRYRVPSMSSDQHSSIFDIDMTNYDTDDHAGGEE